VVHGMLIGTFCTVGTPHELSFNLTVTSVH
jgi:hypothetical protein